MKFSVLVAIVPEEKEQETIDAAREQGAGGMTLLSARGISDTAKKSFFGMTYDGSQKVILMILERSLSIRVMKAVKHVLIDEHNQSDGVVFTSPIEHLAGIDVTQLDKFEQHVKESLKGNEI